MTNRLARLASLGALLLAACDDPVSSPGPVELPIDAQLRQSIATWGVIPIGDVSAADPELVALGRALFFDRILSGNRDISCATCHHPDHGLGDGRSLPVGTGAAASVAGREPGPGRELVHRNAPTLLNAGLGTFYLFWDGRLASAGTHGFRADNAPPLPAGLPNALVAQAMLPVVNPREMLGEPGDTDVFGEPNELALLGPGREPEIWQAIMDRLLDIPEYVAMFEAAFPDRRLSQLRFQDAAFAIATFQTEAFTKKRSPFDRYLDRDDTALDAEQKRGALLFFGEAQCGSCHGGPFLGGQGFANVGVPQIGPGSTLKPPLDLGRGELQNQEFYRFAFRVAPLRNVELTAPYMHNGAYPTLEAVLDHYDDVASALATYDASEHAPALAGLVHDDAATIAAVMETLDFRLRTPLDLTDDEKRDILAFLKSLTDPAARNLGALVPARVPSALPID